MLVRSTPGGRSSFWHGITRNATFRPDRRDTVCDERRCGEGHFGCSVARAVRFTENVKIAARRRRSSLTSRFFVRCALRSHPSDSSVAFHFPSETSRPGTGPRRLSGNRRGLQISQVPDFKFNGRLRAGGLKGKYISIPYKCASHDGVPCRPSDREGPGLSRRPICPR